MPLIVSALPSLELFRPRWSGVRRPTGQDAAHPLQEALQEVENTDWGHRPRYSHGALRAVMSASSPALSIILQRGLKTSTAAYSQSPQPGRS